METDNFRVLLDIRRMDRVPNALIREFCRVTKGVDERIYASIVPLYKSVRNKSDLVY